MKEGKDLFENLMSDLELSKMLVNEINIYYKCIMIKRDWLMLEKACDLILELIDINYRKNIWLVKIRALSQIKN